ncbi:MAG: hypothetical protein JW944_09960 [Deltaproteobacteria bacterium]|nr:hypothetical protein [Deltaproteobacteria bacterium]
MTIKDDSNLLNDPRSVSGSRKKIDDELNLIDLVYPIYKRRKFLIFFCLAIAFVVGARSFFLPKTYEATAVILPVSEQSGSSITQGLASTFLQQFGMSGLMSGSTSTPSSALYMAVLKSNELAAEVLDRYDYFHMMGIDKSYEKNSSKAFAKMLKVNVESPAISVTVTSSNPVFASDLANSYIKELDRYNLNNSFTSARYLREYIEKRLYEANSELDQAQMELREFQEKNRAISISDQADATLKVLREMEAQKVSLEVELASKEKFYKGQHIQLEQLKAQIEALQKNIDRLTYSEDGSITIEKEEGKIEFYIPLNNIPGLNFEESKLLLKVQAKTAVVTLLTTRLEQAKLDEAKDFSTINTLEFAYPPEKPTGPRIKLNIMLSLIVSFFLGLFIVFFIEVIDKMNHEPETAPKWLEMKEGLRGFLKFIKRYKR